MQSKILDVIVVGGGHAGIEAAWSAAQMGSTVAMVTMEVGAIGRMSCNPAIGGVAKGQLVRDIDALGGLMGILADKSGIQFRMLNRSKGPAVWGPRAQMDMDLYAEVAQGYLTNHPNISFIEGEVLGLNPVQEGQDLGFWVTIGNQQKGVQNGKDTSEQTFQARNVVITTGTFLGALMYTGLDPVAGGRIGESPANELAHCIKGMGLKTRRLKTGTPSRLRAESIDYKKCTLQPGDADPIPFSFRTVMNTSAGQSRRPVLNNSAVCWITYTNKSTHEILKEGFDQSPMFTGKIDGLGPRYCPSIEDKIDRFEDKDSHQLFLEPEGVGNNRIYVNGFSSSLPADVQKRALQTIPGLENCEILRYGYAVEYDAIDATQLNPTYECKEIPGLFFAGQVNGTSGYEEAAAQGLVAGVNAALRIQEKEPFVLDRTESYIGVLTDDLVTMETDEPYRMFTSRSEYRLYQRQDNAETRLADKGYKLGVLPENVYRSLQRDRDIQDRLRNCLRETKLPVSVMNPILEAKGKTPLKESDKAMGLLKRPEIHLQELLPLLSQLSKNERDIHWNQELSATQLQEIESEIKYAGFFERQQKEIDRVQKLSALHIPQGFDYEKATSLSIESRQKLQKLQPMTVGNAQNISGVTPADISALIYHINHGN
jgi:tRNA uridine 5-carboxymethylaminomethyl modification enzyme